MFKFYDEEGHLVDVKRRHINSYIKEVMGERFSAKDFRTWAGTLICACALARGRTENNGGKSTLKKKVVEAIKETASHLGNTPAVCRSSYINPAVFESFEKGQAVEQYFCDVLELVEHRTRGLHASERALLKLLEESAA